MRCDFCHRTIKIKIKVVNDFKNKQKRVKHAATQIHHQLEVHQFILLTADSLGSQQSQRVTGLTQSDNKLSHPPVAKLKSPVYITNMLWNCCMVQTCVFLHKVTLPFLVF